MLLIALMNDPVVGSETVGMDHALQTYFTGNYLHQRIFTNIRNDLDINFTVSFIDSEDNGFAQRSATAFASHVARTEVGFVQFDLAGERRFVFAKVGDSLAD